MILRSWDEGIRRREYFLSIENDKNLLQIFIYVYVHCDLHILLLIKKVFDFFSWCLFLEEIRLFLNSYFLFFFIIEIKNESLKLHSNFMRK